MSRNTSAFLEGMSSIFDLNPSRTVVKAKFISYEDVVPFNIKQKTVADSFGQVGFLLNDSFNARVSILPIDSKRQIRQGA